MVEWASQVSDYLSALGLDAVKSHYKEKLDEAKLQRRLTDFILKQKEFQEVCSLSEECDYAGLIEYIKSSFLNSVTTRIFAPNSNTRRNARAEIVDAAVSYAQANTIEARQRVAALVSKCLDILKSFYASGIKINEFILATEIVEAVNETTRAVAEDIIKEIHAASAAGSMFSMDTLVQQASSGDLVQAERNLRMLFGRMSMEHPLAPYYGYTWKNDALISEPQREDAVKLYPPRFNVTGKLRIGDTYVDNPSRASLDYAYRHQQQIVLEIDEAKKYLGDRLDPIQEEAKKMAGSVLYANPPEFPPAFPCSIKVGEEVYFEYLLMRTQEILDDGTIIVGNRAQESSHFIFEFSISSECEGRGSFKVQTRDLTSQEKLQNLRFIHALMLGKPLCLHILDIGQDLLHSKVNDVNYDSGFPSIEAEVDFWERVCVIENRFSVSLDVDARISKEDYDLVIYLSNLIRQEKVTTKWGSVVFTGIIDNRFRENLLKMDGKPMAISYVGTCTITLWGTPMTIDFMRTFKMAYIKDLERIQKKVAVLDNGDTLKITFIPGTDNTQVDTTRIPPALMESCSLYTQTEETE